MRSLLPSRFNLAVILGIAIAYSLNRFWLKIVVDVTVISYLLKCHFNDWLAGIAIIAYLNFILSISKFRYIEITTARTAAEICFLCGLLWEYILPLIFPHGTSDVWDVVAYVSGGMVYVLLLKYHRRKSYQEHPRQSKE